MHWNWKVCHLPKDLPRCRQKVTQCYLSLLQILCHINDETVNHRS
jgi:hypothetical protein